MIRTIGIPVATASLADAFIAGPVARPIVGQ
jgi:hypothetical protein